MKKTILLLVTVLLVGTSFAQYNKQKDRDNDYGYNKDRGDKFDRGRDKIYFFTARERDIELAQINREYTNRIESVRRKFFMSRFHKERQVQSLLQQRDYEVRQVWMKYNDKRNKGDGRDSNDWGYRKH